MDWAIEQLKLMEWVGSLKFWATENFRWAILYIINIRLLIPANNVGIAWTPRRRLGYSNTAHTSRGRGKPKNSWIEIVNMT